MNYKVNDDSVQVATKQQSRTSSVPIDLSRKLDRERHGDPGELPQLPPTGTKSQGELLITPRVQPRPDLLHPRAQRI
eukprot:CAMPEP_0183420248 /NCGR_PEP_ID=MMETSP0370-20130417/26329_1 /TAXON_ID=268820 /ORGANISM="Peridinium aciculiferum, Strain PAER-2" /LENGTH=76 /DNA_ID=CAMNT_0025604119 /DNA_START=1 /DNA_END=228 /DNA_ORIENTATION=-